MFGLRRIYYSIVVYFLWLFDECPHLLWEWTWTKGGDMNKGWGSSTNARFPPLWLPCLVSPQSSFSDSLSIFPPFFLLFKCFDLCWLWFTLPQLPTSHSHPFKLTYMQPCEYGYYYDHINVLLSEWLLFNAKWPMKW